MRIRTDLRTDKLLQDGLHPIVFVVDHKKFTTGETCRPEAWEDSEVGARYRNAHLINKRLTKKRAALAAIIDEAQRPIDWDEVRARFNAYVENPDAPREPASVAVAVATPDLLDIVNGLIDEHRTTWSKGYKKRFNTLAVKFAEYDPAFKIDLLTAEWWKGYVNHCVEELENSNNTINADAKICRRLVELLRAKGHVLKIDLEAITHKYIEPEIMALSWENVGRIAALDLREPLRSTFPASRLLWLAGAYTGRRWGEIARMSEKNFYRDQAGRHRYRSTGKGMKPVDIPLLPEAVEFFKSIKYTLPTLAQQTVNADIKDIARAAGINTRVLKTTIIGKELVEEFVPEWKTVHIHTGRHSYAMRVVDLSGSQPHFEKFVSFMLGHASYATTWKYINRRASSHDKLFDLIALQK